MFKNATATLHFLIPLQAYYNILEKQLIAKFGSYDHAHKEVTLLRKKFKGNLEFINSLYHLIYTDKILALLLPLQNVKTLPELIKYVSEINSNKMSSSISENELLEFIRMQDIYKQEVELIIQNEKINLFKEVDKKPSFTLEQIREDLQINQRPFKKWLQHFFKDKYDNTRKISLSQYIEIYQMLILQADEDKFNFNLKAEDYLNRIEKGLVFSKGKLIKLTGSDYKQLSIKMKSKKELHIVGSNLSPYGMSQKIIEEMG